MGTGSSRVGSGHWDLPSSCSEVSRKSLLNPEANVVGPGKWDEFGAQDGLGDWEGWCLCSLVAACGGAAGWRSSSSSSAQQCMLGCR